MFILNISLKYNTLVGVDSLDKTNLNIRRNCYKTLEETHEIVLRKQRDLYYYTKKYANIQLSNTLNSINLQRQCVKITYFFIFKVSYANCMVHIVDCEGNSLRHINSGLLGFQGRQKSGRYAILAVLNELAKYEHKLRRCEIALVFLGLFKKHSIFITNKIKTKFKVKIIKYNNMQAHNGCRPKKIRRLKKINS